METQALYDDIALRCGGDIYIGVVGPVRTGKSTFIKRFMETIILPRIEDDASRTRAVDELPQSGTGRTIMTTQPKFVPNEAVEVALGDGARMRVRLVDSVGYPIRGVMGLEESGDARMVRTPWFDRDIPFEQAAELGTQKVIRDHATIGLVVTTDGSITEFPRSAYVEAEERVIGELRSLGKPFAVALNSADPQGDAALALRQSLQEKYDAPVAALSAADMDEEDICALLKQVLYEFPLTEAVVRLPAWVSALKADHWLNAALTEAIETAAREIERVRDVEKLTQALGGVEYCADARMEEMRVGTGGARIAVTLPEALFYRVLTEESGQTVKDEEHLLYLMTEMTGKKRLYDRVAKAMEEAERTGYGLVVPDMTEMTLDKPEIVRTGNRYGVRIKANAASMHLIRANIATEIAPLIGTEAQADDLIAYLKSEFEENPDAARDTNIFGRTLNDLVRDGLAAKLNNMPDAVRVKLRDAIEKILNEGNGGVVCILL